MFKALRGILLERELSCCTVFEHSNYEGRSATSCLVNEDFGAKKYVNFMDSKNVAGQNWMNDKLNLCCVVWQSGTTFLCPILWPPSKRRLVVAWQRKHR